MSTAQAAMDPARMRADWWEREGLAVFVGSELMEIGWVEGTELRAVDGVVMVGFLLGCEGLSWWVQRERFMGNPGE
jgi:hypothetical protein